VAQYHCHARRRQYGVPVCQPISRAHIDAWVVAMFFEALSPIEPDASQRSVEQQHRHQEPLDLAYRQRIQRLQYRATRAQRQFDPGAPENRLVAAELERRWEQRLREVTQAKKTYERYQQAPQPPLLPPERQETFRAIGQ
jgi:hypothetical protein